MALNGEKIPISFRLGDKVIDGATVKPLSFLDFAEAIKQAQDMQQPKSWESRLRRARLMRQVTYYSNGSVVPIVMDELLRMPIPVARTISEKLDTDVSTAGKVIRPGDGIEQAITFELGTPIPTGAGKDPIKELEFSAQTYGDIEDVMSALDSITQTALLIQTIAKPLGSSLLLLPSWAMAHITVSDGLAISRGVLPHFLGSPVESSSE